MKMIFIIVGIALMIVGGFIYSIARDNKFVEQLAVNFAEQGAIEVLDDTGKVVSSSDGLDDLTMVAATVVAEKEAERVCFWSGVGISVGLGLLLSAILYL